MAQEDIYFSVVGGADFALVFHYFADGGCVEGATIGFDKVSDLAVVCCVDRFLNNVFLLLLFGLFYLGTCGLTLCGL